ncbi:MAG TPA: hypothetical protein VJ885_03005 [Thermoanaerobaculia bacterium]|nr:hypothetical protein [Thermoanaerobaculia bacterium]
MRTTRFTFALALTLPLTGLAGAPAGVEAAESGRPLLVSTRNGVRLQLPSGTRIPLPAPAGATFEQAASLGNEWLVAGLAPDAQGRSEILLLTGDGRAVTQLPPPPGRTFAIRQEPLPLIADGQLAGLLWLEGDDRRSFGVQFAEWNGESWSAAQTVAPAGPGSQLALTAAHLTDGSWIASWSAFDGKDDEIVWSRRGKDGSWSRSLRVTADNQTPDVTPALTATRDGVFLAWSRYDGGDYRVVVSRFRGGKWTAPAAAAPAGSGFPSFEPAPGGRTWMLYRNAEPRGWTVAELDKAGRPARQAVALTATAERPVVEATGKGLALAWPGRAERIGADWEKRQ